MRELVDAVERRLTLVPSNTTIKVDVEITETNTSHSVSSTLLGSELRTSAKKLRADGQSLDVSGTLVAQIIVEWDKDGVSIAASSADSDWVAASIMELKEYIQDSQSPWLFRNSDLTRGAASVVSIVDAIGLGVLSAFGLGKLGDGSPNVVAGVSVGAIALLIFLSASFFLPLFGVIRENGQGLYLLFTKLLVSFLLVGVTIQVLVNLAT